MGNLKIGSRIRELREAEKLTQEELSERANIANRALQRLESDQNSPNLETVAAVAKALGITLGRLFASPDDFAGLDPEILDALRRADPLSIRLVRAALRLSDVVQQDVRVQKEQKLKTQR